MKFGTNFLFIQFCQKYPLFRKNILDMYKALYKH